MCSSGPGPSADAKANKRSGEHLCKIDHPPRLSGERSRRAAGSCPHNPCCCTRAANTRTGRAAQGRAADRTARRQRRGVASADCCERNSSLVRVSCWGALHAEAVRLQARLACISLLNTTEKTTPSSFGATRNQRFFRAWNMGRPQTKRPALYGSGRKSKSLAFLPYANRRAR